MKSASPSCPIFSLLSSSTNPRRSSATPAVRLLDRSRKSVSIWTTVFHHRFLEIAAPAAQKFCSALSILHTACQLSRCWDFLSQFRQSPSKPGFPEAGVREIHHRCASFDRILGNFTIAITMAGNFYACSGIFPIPACISSRTASVLSYFHTDMVFSSLLYTKSARNAPVSCGFLKKIDFL